MSQNIYDDEDFFNSYAQLLRSQQGLEGAPEWPDLETLLPDLAGKTVVDLGCGYGWFCRAARRKGAAEVRGFDLSEKMLARARGFGDDPAIIYSRADLETLELPENCFDLVYSSLALHYIADLAGLFGRIFKALKSGGSLVFSMEHPIYTAPLRQQWEMRNGELVWPLSNYLNEGERRTNWLADGVIKQHRTEGTILNLLIETGFNLRHVCDWGPSPELVRAEPDLARERERPAFLLVKAIRQSQPGICAC